VLYFRLFDDGCGNAGNADKINLSRAALLATSTNYFHVDALALA